MTENTTKAVPESTIGGFPNYAGRSDVDEELAAELAAAGIPCGRHAFLARDGQVRTSVIGVLHGWSFRRAWCYWICKGPGIEVEAAEQLHRSFGREVRVEGHCGCPSPREWFKGLACGHYHVDTLRGLAALATTINELVTAIRDEPRVESRLRPVREVVSMPKRRVHLSLEIGADSHPDLAASLLNLHLMAAAGDPIPLVHVERSVGFTAVTTHDPQMDHATYHQRLNAWLASKLASESSGEMIRPAVGT